MARSKMPKFESLDKLVEFFDSHDMGDYWENMPEVHFDIDLKRRTHFFALDEDLAAKVTAIAKAKRTSSRNLINKVAEGKGVGARRAR